MPLIQSASKKAFQKNVETEMKANPGKKNRSQNLAIAYSVQRKNRKKMADGGTPDVSSAQPGETMQEYQDRMDKKSKPGNSPDQQQAEQSMKKAFAHGGKIDEEMAEKDHSEKEESAKYEDRPSPHGYAKGGAVDSGSEDENKATRGEARRGPAEYGSGPEYDANPGLPHAKPDNRRPSMSSYMSGDFGSGEHENSTPSSMPYSGHMDEDFPSIARAIMHKMKQMADGGMAYADGGEVDLSENADEEPNHEDDLSFEALKKENYSESEGLEHMGSPHDSNLHGHELSDEDAYDMVDSIRKKMRMKNRPE